MVEKVKKDEVSKLRFLTFLLFNSSFYLRPKEWMQKRASYLKK